MHRSRGRQHHLICQRCQDVTEVDAGELMDWVGDVAAYHGFSDLEVRAAILGVYRICQRS
ncbi:MAG: hypothetical protein GEU98_04665 [Pseudonocardiaceae bacterium]|nr:hypothetical protein [Pseudonocardiaceae bacterium]